MTFYRRLLAIWISFYFFISLGIPTLNAQELNAQVIINADLVDQTNRQIFETLERALNEFLGTQFWTDRELLDQERIRCSFVINLTKYQNNQFEGTLQVQSLRPVYDSDYESPVLNFLDRDVVFSYQEYQPLFFNAAQYQSNLVSLISFYAYLILGLDAETYAPNGGDVFFEEAQKVVNLAQQTKIKGWNQNDSSRNRFWLIDRIRSNTFQEYRQALYTYHRNGMDQLSTAPSTAKTSIIAAIEALEKLYQRRPNAFVLQLFFDAKSKEIVDVFSGGPKVEVNKTKKTLQTIAPFFASEWKQIKN